MTTTRATTTREERRARFTPGEVRSSGGDGAPLRISGTAIRYGVWTDLGPGVWERIMPGAARSALDAAPDLVLVIHHDVGRPVARRGRNMRVWEDAAGVHFDAELPDTSEARDLWENVRAGVIEGMSFAFSLRSSDETVDYRDGGEWHSVERIAKLWELTATAMPAYAQTTMAARAKPSTGELAETVEAAAARARRELARRGAGRVTVREPEVYGRGSGNSFFADRLMAGGASIEVPGVGLAGATAEAARARLAAWGRQAEERAISTTLGAGGELAAMPQPIAAAFASAARAVAVVAPLYRQEPVEFGKGDVVQAVKLTTGASAGMQTEGSATSSSDPVTARVQAGLGVVAGRVTVSLQLFDLSDKPRADEAIAEELGAAMAAALDVELIAGTGTLPRLNGLLNVSGATAGTYTDASPTVPELIGPLAQLYSTTATARGLAPSVALMHTRRWAWISAALDAQNRPLMPPAVASTEDLEAAPGVRVGVLPPGLVVYCTPAVPTNLGGGTEDRIILVRPSDLVLFKSPLIVEVAWQPAIANGQVVISCRQYAAAFADRRAAGVGILGGSGLAAPAGF